MIPSCDFEFESELLNGLLDGHVHIKVEGDSLVEVGLGLALANGRCKLMSCYS